MSFEQPKIESGIKKESKAKVEIEDGYEQFIPVEFRNDPFGYFEREGRNIKSGEIKYDENGRITEDPTAVKDLPPWQDQNGKLLEVVARRVNIEKGEIKKSGDPFYEYKIIKLVRSLGLPAARPIARAELGRNYLIVMEKIKGVRWSEKDKLNLRERGYSDEDIEDLKRQAQERMEKLRQRFEAAGIERGWKLKDMVFDIDIERRRIINIIPTDWERTKINQERVQKYRKKLQID